MQTVILNAPYELKLTETEMPKPGPGEVLIQIHTVGICGTDYHAYRGNQPYFEYPRILGHELAGEVVQIGDGTDVEAHTKAGRDPLQPGDRCTVLPYLSCGECHVCLAGRTNCCTRLRVLGVHVDGGLREWLVVPYENVVPSNTLSLDQLALVENQSIGAHAVSRGGVRQGETALVVGAGPIGIGVMQSLNVVGARVIALDLATNRTDFCRRAFDFVEVIDPKSPLDHLKELTDGRLADVVFDATGNLTSMGLAPQYAAQGGRIVMVGLASGHFKIDDAEFHRRELTLYASRNATLRDFQWVMEHMEHNAIDIHPMITHRSRVTEVVDVFPGWVDTPANLVKAMVDF